MSKWERHEPISSYSSYKCSLALGGNQSTRANFNYKMWRRQCEITPLSLLENHVNLQIEREMWRTLIVLKGHGIKNKYNNLFYDYCMKHC